MAHITPDGNDEDNGTKIKTKLTVSHLPIAIRLLMDTGIIMKTNATDIITMVSKTFKTGRNKNISDDSLEINHTILKVQPLKE
ncbi:MAG: hypothetical protein ABIT58_08940 [Ferruginibacter sp.]